MATTFRTGLSPRTASCTGTLAAEPSGRRAELQRRGLTPVSVSSGLQKRVRFELPQFGRGRRVKDVLFFTQELATLLSSGVPLDRALSITSELTERPQFRGIIQEVLRSIKGGRSLADGRAAHPEYFSISTSHDPRLEPPDRSPRPAPRRLSAPRRSKKAIVGLISIRCCSRPWARYRFSSR
jgi:general secretion pathway protein F